NKNDLAKPEIIAALKILNNLSPAAYLAGQGELWALIALRGVNLSIKHGIHRYSSVAFTEYSLMLSAYGNYKRAFLFATLGQRLSEKWGTLSLFQKSRNSLVIGNFTYPWNRHIKESEEINASGYQAGLDSGNLIYAGYILLNQPLCSFYQGLPLKSILEKLPGSLNFTKKNKDELSYNAIMATRIVASSLAGLTKDKSYFDTDEIDDQSYLENCHTVKDLWSVSQYLNLKAQALYHYDEFEEALKVITEAKNFLGYTQGLTTIISSHNFYHSLILAALYPTKDKKEKKEFMIQLKANQAQMKIWTENCPENFQHKYLMINAEIGRIKNHKKWKVVGLYEDSIEEARKNNFIQNDALANELATKYWIEIGKRKFAEAYLLTAFRRYEEWGAKRKTDILKEKYKDIFKERKKEASATIEKTITSTTTSSATALYSGQALDLQSVIKSSNVIAGEIKLESLLDKMMRIMIENAGAERGILLLKNEEGLFIEAEGRVDQQDVSVMKSISVKDYKDIPSSIIYFVERTKQNLVLTNASLDDKFNQDDYLREHQIKSVLCAPIMQKGALSGIFYLENNLSEGAFTPDRLQIINILSGQAAISIDNALLYANMEQKVRDRTRELALANEELEMKNKHITESIEYSLTIQQAILPPRALLKNVLHNYFLLFRPKDIVAGDFYWFSKIDDDNIFVVTADCTGQGVPGALMSMIGNNFLNQIVNEKHIFDPSLILQGLNESVRIALQQDKEDTSSRDGMDLCLCKISGNKVTFAGAKRPLIVMKDGKLEVVKGDLASIGGRQKSEKTQYTNREIEIVKGKTSIYLTTDGYIDQPDPDRNRIGSKGLYNLIEKYHNLTGDEQLLKFSDALDSHKRYEEQRDDITVMGIMF
ncbi:MAG: SpoIIE family protein phosphatase, partial [Leptospira sp.]|nr:SpoIIE family protein phosphatase [Leptospira sp.]